jgi:hypothetical protein
MLNRSIATTIALAVTFVAVSASANEATPSTNEDNKNMGWAHVNELEVGIGTVFLEFVSTRNFASCFEYRSDGDTNEQVSDTNPNLDIDDGLYPFVCETNSSSEDVFYATEYVEVRMVFGAEHDERFDWTRFYVAREEAAKADCRDGQWETYGFRNQGQCIRYLETGIDDR